jgi:hypothetical protein
VLARPPLGKALWAGAALGYAWVAGGFRPFTWPAAVSTAAAGLVVLCAAWRYPGPDRLVAVQRRVVALWAAWLVIATGWELWALFNQPRSSYPTISSLVDRMIDTHPARSVALLAWLGLGWLLARR